MIVELFEPFSHGQVSGGFLYNQQLSHHASAFRRHSTTLEGLEGSLKRLSVSSETVLLVDSLFLNETALEVLLRWRAKQRRPLGFLIHSFPSFLARAQSPLSVDSREAWLPTATEQSMLRELDLIVAPGPYVPELLSTINIRTPTLVCLPGIPQDLPALAQARRLPEGQRQIVSMGAVTRNKGHLDALSALTQLNGMQFQWTILGDTQLDVAHCRALSQRIESVGLTKQVALLPQVEHREALRVLDSSTLLLVPSYTENQPLVVMEAMCLGVPVVSYDVGACANLIGRSGAGIVVPLRDTKALATAIGAILSDTPRYAAASLCGLETTRNWPSWNQSCHGLLQELTQFSKNWRG